MKKLLKTLAILVLFINLSCRTDEVYDYYVYNETSSKCLVLFSLSGNPTQTNSLGLEPGARQKIYTTIKGKGKVRNYQKGRDRISDIHALIVFKDDTIVPKTDLLKAERWLYIKGSEHKAEYTLTVTEDDY